MGVNKLNNAGANPTMGTTSKRVWQGSEERKISTFERCVPSFGMIAP